MYIQIHKQTIAFQEAPVGVNMRETRENPGTQWSVFQINFSDYLGDIEEAGESMKCRREGVLLGRSRRPGLCRVFENPGWFGSISSPQAFESPVPSQGGNAYILDIQEHLCKHTCTQTC